MQEQRFFSCQDLTPSHAWRARAWHWPQQQKHCLHGPLRRSICLPLVPDLSAGLIRGQRAGRSSRRLCGVSLMGCKDKQISGMRRGLVVVMSLWFTPGSFRLITDNLFRILLWSLKLVSFSCCSDFSILILIYRKISDLEPKLNIPIAANVLMNIFSVSYENIKHWGNFPLFPNSLFSFLEFD